MSKARPAAAAGTTRRATKQRWSAAKKAQARKSGTKMTAREERRAAERAASGQDTRHDRRDAPDRAERGERRYSRDSRDDRREYRGGREDRGYDKREDRGYGARSNDQAERRDFRRDDRAEFRRDNPRSSERGHDRDERPTRVDRWGNAQRRDDRDQRGYGSRNYTDRDSRDSRGFGERRGFRRDGERNDRFERDNDRRGRDTWRDRSDSGERPHDRDERFERRGGNDRDGAQRDRFRDDRYRRDDRYSRDGGDNRYNRDDRYGRDGDSRYRRDDRDSRWENRRNDRWEDRRGETRGERRDRPERNDRSREERAGSEFRRAERPERPRGYDRTARHDDSAPTEFEAERMRRTERPRRVELPEDPNDGFAGLGVPMPIVERLARDGIAEPFPIQKATIPDAIAGRDVLGRGRTGSGKTMAFGIPVLTRLAGGRSQPHRPRALIMSPTRELAMQISDALATLVREMGLRHKLVAGGMPYEPQIDALERGVDVLIATPGRMNDLVEKGAAALDAIEIVVLDEADLMADMGFLPEVSALLDLVPAGGQRLLFSATLDKGVDSLVETYLTDPVEHSTDEAKASVATMTHHIFLVEPQHKKPITGDIANRPGRTVVFVRTKLGADRVALQLRDQGVFAAALHGGLNQGVRNRILAAFKDGTLPVLVATDVASRGIHVDDVSAVLQVDPPRDHKDYLHRAGRTARAGSEGVVVTLALPHQRRLMKRIASDAGLDGVEPTRVDLGDDTVIAATGAERPSGVPVSEERLRAITDPPKRRPMRRQGGFGGGRGRGGYGGRGGRPGGGRRYEDRG